MGPNVEKSAFSQNFLKFSKNPRYFHFFQKVVIITFSNRMDFDSSRRDKIEYKKIFVQNSQKIAIILKNLKDMINTNIIIFSKKNIYHGLMYIKLKKVLNLISNRKKSNIARFRNKSQQWNNQYFSKNWFFKIFSLNMVRWQ